MITAASVVLWCSNADTNADVDREGDLGRRGEHQGNSRRPKRLGAARPQAVFDVVLHRRVFAKRLSSPGAGVPLRQQGLVVQRQRIQKHLSHQPAGQHAHAIIIIIIIMNE